MKEISLNIEHSGNELIIRQGEAAPIIQPETVEISGDINTISEYVSKRTKQTSAGLQKINKDTVIVTVDKKTLSIKIDFDPHDVFAPVVIGKLEFSEELKKFSINGNGKTFSREELIKLLKFSRLSFASPEKHSEVLRSYQAFSAKANTDIKQDSDSRGNKVANYAKSVETNIPTEFILSVPIFKGQKKELFRVEICIDVTDGGARFWFESVELEEIIQTRVDEIFSIQLKECKDFVIVNV